MATVLGSVSEGPARKGSVGRRVCVPGLGCLPLYSLLLTGERLLIKGPLLSLLFSFGIYFVYLFIMIDSFYF